MSYEAQIKWLSDGQVIGEDMITLDDADDMIQYLSGELSYMNTASNANYDEVSVWCPENDDISGRVMQGEERS